MTERKKILWLVSWYPNRDDPFDGDFIQRHARAAAIFHDIHVICVKGTAGPIPEATTSRATGLTEQVFYYKEDRGVLRHFTNYRSWTTVFKKAVADYIEKVGKPHLVHVHVPWKAGLMGLWMKRKYGIPYLVTEHWGMYDPQVNDHFGRRPIWVREWLRRIYRGAAAITTVSRYLAKGIQKTIGRKPGWIIPNVVDTTLFFHKPDKYSRFTFIHVSNMVPLKNADVILAAFAELAGRHDHIQLMMVGNRDKILESKAAAAGLLNQSVFFRGEIPYLEVAAEMRRSHCLVLFSQTETFSCVTAEALCAGLPVVAATSGALPELLDKDNGKLVPLGNTQDLAAAMESVLKDWNSFDGQAIASKAASKYGYTAVSQAFDQLYRSV